MNPLQLDDAADEFANLATQYLTGEADAAAVTQLNALLSTDAQYRARFTVLARLHGHLSEIGRRAAAGSVDSARLLAPGPMSLPQSPVAKAYTTRRWAGWVAAASIMLTAGIIVLALGATALKVNYLVPIIARTEGNVHVIRDGAAFALRAGTKLCVGDRLRIDADSRVQIALRGGTCELTSGSEAVVEEVDGLRRRFSLIHGELNSDVTAKDTPLAVQTQAATIAVTDAVVRIKVASGGTAIAVSRGSVEVRLTGGASRTLPAGQRLDLPAIQVGGISAASYAQPADHQAVVSPVWRNVMTSERMLVNQTTLSDPVCGNTQQATAKITQADA